MIWRDIPGWEGFYQVSDTGQIKSLSRSVMRGNGRPQRWPERILKPTLTTEKGHFQVSLRREGVKTNTLVHRVTALAFLGECPKGMEVCHNNGDGLDNRVENLRYDTRRANQIDAVKHKAHVHSKKTRCSRGHDFNEVNTKRCSSTESGKARRCLACSRATAYIRFRPEIKTERNLQIISDLCYQHETTPFNILEEINMKLREAKDE